ncbi:MAG: chalcone isomerase family protein [Gammaproteobacteria bacterium]|nr:chalcone isomerase family protein [Gammaproteobacteria bacterium]
MISFMGKQILIGIMIMLVSVHSHARVTTLQELPQSRMVGSGKLTWLGVTVYQIKLYAPEGRYRADHPHAIKINYELSFSREKMAQRSLKEIERIYGKQPKRKKMERELASVFRDVVKGDHITGVHYPGKGADFYGKHGLFGRLDDAELAAAFFAIWLDQRTSEPDLRSKLLGEMQ